MSQYLVVDSSFIMSDFLPDEASSMHELSAYSIYVPAIFYLECTNVLNTALKRKRITQADFHEYLQVLGSLPFIVDKFSATAECMHVGRGLCQQFDLTSYDACYLELTLRLGAKLGTYDQQLAMAGEKSGVVVLR